MFTSTGEAFAPPLRQPDFTIGYGEFNPDFSASRGLSKQVWMPNDNEPTQLRSRIVTHAANKENPFDRDNVLAVEHLAAAGMRTVFEQFNIRSFYSWQPDVEAYGVPVNIHETALTLPSSKQHARLVEEYADNNKRTVKYRVQHCDGHYNAETFLSALGSGQLLMSTGSETIPKDADASTYYLHFYAHDLRDHFPAWLCLPQDMSERIRRKASDTINEHNFRQSEATLKRVKRLTFLLDQTVNSWVMEALVRGETGTYDERMEEIIGFAGRPFSEQTLEHIKSPNEQKLLSARRF